MRNKREIPLRERNIVLIGFMGVGKTTIGQRVASKLFRDFIDIDHLIEQQFGMSVQDIFKQYGEQRFRETELAVVRNLCENTRLKVISLGGGAFLQDEIRKICLSTSIVLFLDLSFDSWKERLELIVNSRPVLRDKSLQEMEGLFNNRQAIYTHNNSKISTDNLTPEDNAEYIVSTLKLGWEIHD